MIGRQFGASAAAFVVAALTGCAQLLPSAQNVTPVQWGSFEEARRAIDRIVPHVTRRPELAAAGIDPFISPAITILTYSDIVQRFSGGAILKPEDLDPGVRQCLAASKACYGYAVNVRHLHRDRIGNFWLDSLNFKREVEITGWTFNALIVLVDDLVVYTLHGGQPKVHEFETVRNPLGPLQGWGDTVGPALMR